MIEGREKYILTAGINSNRSLVKGCTDEERGIERRRESEDRAYIQGIGTQGQAGMEVRGEKRQRWKLKEGKDTRCCCCQFKQASVKCSCQRGLPRRLTR